MVAGLRGSGRAAEEARACTGGRALLAGFAVTLPGTARRDRLPDPDGAAVFRGLGFDFGFGPRAFAGAAVRRKSLFFPAAPAFAGAAFDFAVFF